MLKRMNKSAPIKNILVLISLTLLLILFQSMVLNLPVYAAPGVSINFDAGEASEGGMGVLDILFMMVIITLGPTILLMMTSFTRIVIVLSFLRNALGTQQSPPNQIIIGLALFLSLFVMSPVLGEIRETAYAPYHAGQITQEQALDNAVKPLKTFMLQQTNKKDLQLFLSISKSAETEETALSNGQLQNLGLEVIVPSFITSELKRAFTMGFLLYIPFLIIDMVVSSTLMSMGMVMLPPATIALPFKILIFVLVDGWGLLLGTLARSFN